MPIGLAHVSHSDAIIDRLRNDEYVTIYVLTPLSESVFFLFSSMIHTSKLVYHSL